LGWGWEINAPGGCKFLSIMDQAQGKRTHLGNAMGFGGMDHGAIMEINPIDMVLLAMFIALAAMWIDR